jgi:hypothetical protein
LKKATQEIEELKRGRENHIAETHQFKYGDFWVKASEDVFRRLLLSPSKDVFRRFSKVSTSPSFHST